MDEVIAAAAHGESHLIKVQQGRRYHAVRDLLEGYPELVHLQLVSERRPVSTSNTKQDTSSTRHAELASFMLGYSSSSAMLSYDKLV